MEFIIDFVFAQNQEFPYFNYPPDIQCGDNFFECLGFFFLKFLTLTIALALALATIFIAWGGIEYIVYGSNEETRKKSTQKLKWGIVGLIVALMSFAFVRFLERAIPESFRERTANLRPVVSEPEPNLPRAINIEILPQPSNPPSPVPPLPTELDFEFHQSPNPLKTTLLKALLWQLLDFVYAAEKGFKEPQLPQEIKCNGEDVPSVLDGTTSAEVWKICFIYYLNRFISFLYTTALMLGVFFLVWAGILYITGPGEPQKTKEIHNKILYGILGITLAILSFTAVKIVSFFFKGLSR
jgi:TRAP-type C4-dicarboxylate transport system permease small subunit